MGDETTGVATEAAPEAVKTDGQDTVGVTEEPSGEEGKKKIEVEETGKEEQPFILKINGKEVKATTQDIIKLAQKAAAAEERFEEAATVRKQFGAIIDKLKTNPAEVLEKIGVDFREMAEKYLYDKITYEQMDEQQRKAVDNERKLKELEEKEKSREEESKNAEQEALKNKYMQEYEENIVKGLEKTKLPRTEGTVKRIAGYLLTGLERNIPLTVDDAILLVQDDYNREVNDLLLSIDDGTAGKMLKPDVVNKIAKLTMQKGQENRANTKPDSPREASKAKKKTWDEYRKELDAMGL